MERIKAIRVNDLRSISEIPDGGLKKGSGRWGCRPLVGMGVMEVQTFGAACAAPNTLRVCRWEAGASIDRWVHLVPVRRYSKGVSRDIRCKIEMGAARSLGLPL